MLSLVLSFCLRTAAISDDSLPIGPTKIPFYTGNTSVLSFMTYWGTYSGQITDLETPERIELLKRISCVADTDYQSWSLAEQQPGKWDFGIYRNNAQALRAAGLKYATFALVHFPPKWFIDTPDFTPYVCAEHGEKLTQFSPWSPKIWRVYRDFYAHQKGAMGDLIDWVRVATPSDYGELGFPAAMTSWLVPQKHAHPGYWCGDEYARADFRAEMKRRFRGLPALNKRWGTSFGSWDNVTYPDLVDEKAAATARQTGKAADRRRWLDFVEWYSGFWTRFTPRLVNLIREFYPDKPMILSVGYASEGTKFGNDYSAFPKMAKKLSAALQTPGNVSYYGLKRLSTPCHFYGCPYYTEPPGDVPPDAEVARVFNDASNGVQVYMEYPQNLDRARDGLRRYKDHLTGERPVVDLAVFNPSTEHRLDCGAGNYPLDTFLLCSSGRDLFDYDVIDEQLIRDGALRQYRILVYIQGSVTEELALRRIASWVTAGGVLITCKLNVETVEGDASLWRRLVLDKQTSVTIDEISSDGAIDWDRFAARRVVRQGRGLVLFAPVDPKNTAVLQQVIARTAYHLGDLANGFRNAPLIDGVEDGVHATLLPDRILYFNGTNREIVKMVSLRPGDWTDGAKRPDKMMYQLTLRPHSIEAILLR